MLNIPERIKISEGISRSYKRIEDESWNSCWDEWFAFYTQEKKKRPGLLSKVDIKAELRAIRIDNDDPFIVYQDGDMSKGCLLEILATAISKQIRVKE